MRTQELPTNLYPHSFYEGCINVRGQRFMVVPADLFEDIRDLGYDSIDIADFMEMYDDWVEAQ